LAADEVINIQPHQFKITHFAISPLHASPKMLTICSVQAAAPFGAIVTRQGRSQTFSAD
jgi:hypothetical protein